MSLVGNAPISEVTTYRKDYVAMHSVRPPHRVPVQEFKDPILGPAEEHVLPYCKYNVLPESLKAEYPEPKEYAEQVAERYPSTRPYLRDSPGGPPDFDVIDSFYADDNRTTYMVSYCARGDFDSKRKRKRTTRELPENWVVPLTTQRCSYRHPRLMGFESFEKKLCTTVKDNLVHSEKEREILEVKTGDSVYMAEIGNTGQEILAGQLHGDPNRRPHFDPEDLLRAKLIRCD